MQEVFVIADNVVTPLGFTTESNYQAMREGKSGVQKHRSPFPPYEEVYLARINEKELDIACNGIVTGNYTKLEKLLLLSIHKVLAKTSIDYTKKDFLCIISTTKGNIDVLNSPSDFPLERATLWSLSKTVQHHFNLANTPLLISNACISGVNALVTGSRFIREEAYAHVLVTGVDLASDFVVSGFQSFKAISSKPCKPFDKNRDGINLGEGCGTLLLSKEATLTTYPSSVSILGGSISNDANHISGPSRTGDGLQLAIQQSLRESKLKVDNIDFLNAHGTATLYNDEMESKAFALCVLQQVPMNSLKGFIGHTLGAAGTIETALCIQSMLNNEVLPTLGFEEIGTPENVTVSNQLVKKEITTILKTASGFGGCNAAIVLTKKTKE